MRQSFFKRTLPRNLFPRAILILILPIILLQLVVGVVFFQRHYEQVTTQMADSVARELSVALRILATSPTPPIAQARLNDLSRPLGVVFLIEEEAELPAGDALVFYDLSGRALARTLRTLIPAPLTVDLETNSRIVDARIDTHMGVLKVLVPRRRVTASNPHQLLVLMIATSLLLMLIAALFLRNQVRPILKLANASEAFGKGQSLPYQPTGAEEVRRAGRAFLAMRGRLERQIEQRTLMLSGVSHDLRTPLTRMKLSLALLDDEEEAEALRRDVEDMERMLEEFLAFARGDQSEQVAEIDVAEMARDLTEQARRTGATVTCAVENPQERSTRLAIRESAMRRALNNLLGNAARYGSQVAFTLRLEARGASFQVEDDGPGIAEADRESALRAFARLDSARNLNTGGNVGLGLSIARDVANSHGGHLTLDSGTKLGGLRATIWLPR